MPELDGKIALVTGASYGIGAGIAMVFAREGAKVAVNYSKSKEEADDVVKRIKGFGGYAIAVKADVSKAENVHHMVETVRTELGEIDVLVNNAGISLPLPFHVSSEENWDKVIAVNLKGTLLCCKAVIPYMMNQQKGKIINISSVSGRLGMAGNAVYSMTKGGIISFTKALARELASYGINVNVVLPGAIEHTHQMEVFPKDMLTEVLRTVPLGRTGKPEEIGEIVSFLVSERSNYVTGHSFIVDGGRSI